MESKGFEPLRRFPDLTVFETVPFSQTWVTFRICKTDFKQSEGEEITN